METSCGYLGRGIIIRDIGAFEVKEVSFLRYLLVIDIQRPIIIIIIIICNELSLNMPVSACIQIYAKDITV